MCKLKFAGLSPSEIDLQSLRIYTLHMKKIVLAATAFCLTHFANAAEVAPSVEKQTCEKAIYPKASLVNEEQGTVVLSVLIGTDGAVVDSKIEKSSGSKTLDKATVKVFTSCKFKPGTKDGKPAQAWTKVEYAWSLS